MIGKFAIWNEQSSKFFAQGAYISWKGGTKVLLGLYVVAEI